MIREHAVHMTSSVLAMTPATVLVEQATVVGTVMENVAFIVGFFVLALGIFALVRSSFIPKRKRYLAIGILVFGAIIVSIPKALSLLYPEPMTDITISSQPSF